MNPLVSIIIPVYNVVDYMDKCINSIIKQTYEELEIIIVDDGSNDGSEIKCEEWALRDLRVIVKHQENLGVSSARNEGIRLAKGEWIAFIDGDDFVSDDYIERLVEKAKDTDAQIIMCGYRYLSNTMTEYSFFGENRLFSKNDRKELMLMILGLKNPLKTNASIGGPCMKLYKKSLLDNNDIRFNESLAKMQDVLFNLYCFENVTKAYYVDISSYYYVHRAESRVHRYSPNHYSVAYPCIVALNDFMKVQSVFEDRKEVFYGKIMGLFLEIIKMEYIRRECPLSLFEKRNHIKKLCESREFKNAIVDTKNIYLNSKMHLLQRIITHKCFLLAYYMIYLKYHDQYR